MGTHNVILVTAILLMTVVVTLEGRNADNKSLSRHKRYLAFPEGSTLSIAICMTVQTGLLPGEIWTEGINWGISYELPNDTKEFKELFGKPKELMQRRHRRDLYFKMETIMNSMGYNGRSCIQRALCEASRNLRANSESLLDEMLRIVFGYPQKRNVILETGAHHQYYSATRQGMETRDECFEMYPSCPFSLIDLALGYYSTFQNLPHT